ncbi:transporter [Halorubrum sp. 48-1-W]|uniref:oligosaccharide flippase family protein n=1 Tax=Halorubrum sp. 48-1-W TaxID=2249761 RepID=UPI000DCE6935|nr:oligosaccharide flippase family protein [Halorubrum sp. 48-1-W]RAW45228.1 transporter [Halorubrum sp. 48-1-W]
MRLGQTSIIHFASRFSSSVLGFVATVFIGRILGSDGLGTYYLVLSMIAWLGILTKMGVPGAITKRISEGESQSAYAIAGVSISTILFVAVAMCVLLFRESVNSYIGYPATEFVVLLLFVNLGQSLVNAVLKGQNLVHVSGIFSPIRTGTRSIIQISTLFVGFGLVGLFAGYTLGYALVAVLGTWIVVRNFDRISLPRRSHFESIISYAKFSWIGSLRSRAFNWVDVSILGFFVSSSLVGIYTAAWNVAVFLILFGGSLSQTLFPEMSSLSADEDREAVADLFETALAFAGLILIPGLVGGTILGERLLRVYGEEFSRGAVVLSVLIVATLIQGYQRQFTNTLNAIDRPDLSFRINAVFILGNVVLNLSIIPHFGVIGAATATAASVAVSLGMAYAMLSSLITFSIPIEEIAKQWMAAAIMGLFVYAGVWMESTYSIVGINIVILFALVGIGATVYFTTLLAISRRFRKTIADNLPA